MYMSADTIMAGISRISHMMVDCLKFSLNAAKNPLKIYPSLFSAIFFVTAYIAVIDAPMVTTGMQHTQNKIFNITRSPNFDMALNNFPSN